jgi:hypothetical protein
MKNEENLTQRRRGRGVVSCKYSVMLSGEDCLEGHNREGKRVVYVE